VRELRPELTLEIGFAYGVSTLFITEALRQNGRGHHIVVDRTGAAASMASACATWRRRDSAVG
jgi:predicted O-methyltransferase YrrM